MAEDALDELQWRAPALAAQMGGIHTNTVLPFFAESPFFDRTANNAVLMTQALYNPSMLHLVQTRAAFEQHLRSMAGLEFIVAHDPSRDDTVPAAAHSGIWVVHKQIRRKRPGQPDAIEPLAAYFVVGDAVYQAPAFLGVMANRLLSSTRALTLLMDKVRPHAADPPKPPSPVDPDAAVLAESLRLYQRHGQEPDAPLVGEPGSFRY